MPDRLVLGTSGLIERHQDAAGAEYPRVAQGHRRRGKLAATFGEGDGLADVAGLASGLLL